MDGAQLLARTERFALDGLAFYRRLSKSTEAQVPGVQFYKAATSSWSNYRASKRGQSRPHFITKLATAVEEIDEALGWLEFMDKGSIASDRRLLQEVERTVRNPYRVTHDGASELACRTRKAAK
jgi:four helix bundle protein